MQGAEVESGSDASYQKYDTDNAMQITDGSSSPSAAATKDDIESTSGATIERDIGDSSANITAAPNNEGESPSAIDAALNLLGGDLVLILIASVMVFIQSLTSCANNFSCYYVVSDRDLSMVKLGTSIGFISAFSCGGMLLFSRFNPVPSRARFLLSGFLLFWWTLGVGFLTFSGPPEFRTASNGYFCTWIAFLLSGYMTHKEIQPVRDFADNVSANMASASEEARFRVYFLLSSILVFLSSIIPCPANSCTGTPGLGIVVSVVSIVVVVVLTYAKDRVQPYASSVMFLLSFWWFISTAILTFSGPFTAVGNGFIGCYAALIFSVLYLQALL